MRDCQFEPNSVSCASLMSVVLQAFGQSFLQPDIAIFKQNLLALQDLDTKWKLFHKVRHTTINQISLIAEKTS